MRLLLRCGYYSNSKFFDCGDCEPEGDGSQNFDRSTIRNIITPATINKKRQGETLGALHTTIALHCACIVSHCLYIDNGYVYLWSFFYIFAQPNQTLFCGCYCGATVIAVRLLLRCGYYSNVNFFKAKIGGAASSMI